MQWLKGNYVPTEAKLRSMVESGFVFPETCKAILKPMEVLELLVHCLADYDDPSLGIHCKIIFHRWPRQWTISSSTVMPTMRRCGIN